MPRGKMSQTERAIIDMMTTPTDEATDARTGIAGYRTRKIRHGEFIDAMIYPMFRREAMADVRAAIEAHKPTSEAKVRINHQRSQDTLIRLANHNFGDGDMLLTMTCAEQIDEERMKREVRNWEARMRRFWRKRGRELKYLCTLEYTESEKNGRRYHLHAIVNGHGFDRGQVERLWKLGFSNSREHQQNERGMAGFAGYLNVYKAKQQKAGRKHWWGSRNLVRPPETYADHKFTPAKMERIARSLETDASFWLEKAYPGYYCIEDVRCHRSDYMPGVYLFARMRRKS